MHDQLSEIIEFMSKSHEKLANIIEAERQVVAHLSSLNYDYIPSHNPDFGPIMGLMEHSMLVRRTIGSYLTSLAQLEDALASNLGPVVQAMADSPGDE